MSVPTTPPRNTKLANCPPKCEHLPITSKFGKCTLGTCRHDQTVRSQGQHAHKALQDLLSKIVLITGSYHLLLNKEQSACSLASYTGVAQSIKYWVWAKGSGWPTADLTLIIWVGHAPPTPMIPFTSMKRSPVQRHHVPRSLRAA
jgi:hypothetical protein